MLETRGLGLTTAYQSSVGDFMVPDVTGVLRLKLVGELGISSSPDYTICGGQQMGFETLDAPILILDVEEVVGVVPSSFGMIKSGFGSQ